MRQETSLTFGRWRQQLHLIIALQGSWPAAIRYKTVAAKLGVWKSVNAFITLFKNDGDDAGAIFAERQTGTR